MSSGKIMIYYAGPAQQKHLWDNYILFTSILATIQRLGVAAASLKTKINYYGLHFLKKKIKKLIKKNFLIFFII